MSMSYESHLNASEMLIGEKASLHVLSLNVIRTIVEQHGGAIEEDLVTNTISINTPEGEAAVCAQKIKEQMGAICHGVRTQGLALLYGMIIVRMSDN